MCHNRLELNRLITVGNRYFTEGLSRDKLDFINNPFTPFTINHNMIGLFSLTFIFLAPYIGFLFKTFLIRLTPSRLFRQKTHVKSIKLRSKLRKE